MKKVFEFVSTVVIALFFVWQLISQSDQYIYSQTNNVSIEQTSTSPSREDVDRSLNELAQRSNSLIVKRLIIPKKGDKGGSDVVYQKYGKGDLTPSLKEASLDDQKSSSVVATYSVMRGTLTNEEMSSYFEKLGLKANTIKKQNYFSVVFTILGANLFILVLLIFLLNFIALTVILRIKELRSVGIRSISGESTKSIIFSAVRSDVVVLLFSFIISNVIGFLALSFSGLSRTSLWKILLAGTFFYDFLLLFLSIVSSFIYLHVFDDYNLMMVIKGKIPIGKIMTIILCCQLISSFIVALSVNGVPTHYAGLIEQKRAAKKWGRLDDYNNLVKGSASIITDKRNHEEDALHWYQFQSEEIENHDAVVVKTNFENYREGNKSLEGQSFDSYHPNGNTIYVTPNYLKLEGIELDKETLTKMNNLKLGEFGLILPEKLKGNDGIDELYRKELGLFTSQEVKPSLIKAYVPDKKQRFVYNNDLARQEQFLKDPIIVVLTPKVTGNNFNSYVFWRRVNEGFSFYKGREQTVNLLKKYHLYGTVSAVENSQQTYYDNVQHYRSNFFILLVCAILSIINSIFLYDSMNLLYFEEFRRDIFIKRISGMSFGEQHNKYLLLQLLVVILGIVFTAFFTRDFGASVISLLIFGFSLVTMLKKQVEREDNYSVMILKGM